MKKIFLIIIGVVIVSGVFYGGMRYGQSQKSFQSLRGGDRPVMGTGNIGMKTMNRDGFISGKIIAKDNQSITLEIRDLGSKIVFYSDQTGIEKSVQGDSADFEIGVSVTVTGTTNEDGSMTAQSIRLRPDLAP